MDKKANCGRIMVPSNLWNCECYLICKGLCKCDQGYGNWGKIILLVSIELWSLKAGNLSQLWFERDRWQWVRKMRPCWLRRWGGRRPWTKDCGWPLEAGKDKESDSPLWASRKGQSPTDTLILAWWDLYWTFELQSCTIINTCYLNH